MKNKFFYLFALLFSPGAKSQTVISDVTIVDVENSRLLYHQSVLISGNTIQSVTPSKEFRVPVNASIIAGRNKFLMPGMIDSHAHSLGDGSLYSDPEVIDLTKYEPYEKQVQNSKLKTEEHYKRYLQCGITTLIDPGSTINLLKIRDSLSRNKILPSVFMAGPLIIISDFGPGLRHDPKDLFYNYADNPDKGKLIVQQQLPYHPAFIKIIFVPDVTFQHIEDSARKKLPVIKAIINEAHKNRLKVAVHATERITAQLAVEAGCDYLVHGIHDEIISNDFVDLLKQHNITLCPTANVEFPFYRVFTQQAGYSKYEIQHADPFALKSLFDLQDVDTALFRTYQKRWGSTKSLWRRDSIRLLNLKKLSDAGIRIVSGTDASSFGNLQAASYLPELLKMKESGMNNWQIIRSSTINATYFMDRNNSIGSLVPGKIADMVLLNKNPVEDLNNLNEIAIVFKNGKAITPDTLISETPEMLVQRQWNAVNGKNPEAFLECFDSNVKVYSYPNTLLYKGTAALKKHVTLLLEKNPNLHCEIKKRIISGHTVIDKLVMKDLFKVTDEQTLIYTIRNGKISLVCIINDK